MGEELAASRAAMPAWACGALVRAALVDQAAHLSKAQGAVGKMQKNPVGLIAQPALKQVVNAR